VQTLALEEAREGSQALEGDLQELSIGNRELMIMDETQVLCAGACRGAGAAPAKGRSKWQIISMHRA